jgi:hypothetical protein
MTSPRVPTNSSYVIGKCSGVVLWITLLTRSRRVDVVWRVFVWVLKVKQKVNMKVTLSEIQPNYNPERLTIDITSIDEYRILKTLTGNADLIADLFNNYNEDSDQMRNMLKQIFKELC